MTQKIVADCSTGNTQALDLTADEEADLVARAADRTTDWAALRMRRDALLSACDFTQLPDAPVWVDKTAWSTYRQALRDLPATTVDPANPVWPTPPQTA